MSRLDSFIRRLSAQRECLGEAARIIVGTPGPVLELGLGNGRTYDHLRTLFPNREVFVFDRRMAAHPDCVPDAAHMIVGDFSETLPEAMQRIGAKAALIHADIGSADHKRDSKLASMLGDLLAGMIASGGIIVSDQNIKSQKWIALPLPPDVETGRYFIYKQEK